MLLTACGGVFTAEGFDEIAASTAWGMALGHSILRLTGRMSPL